MRERHGSAASGRADLGRSAWPELGGKPRFSFAEPLPAGLTVAATPGYATTRTFTTSLGAVAGSTSVAFRGSLVPGRPSCSCSIRVTGATPGTKVSTPNGLVGLDSPTLASLLVG